MSSSMRESMRKKPSRATDTATDSGENETVGSNPWANEESNFHDSLSRQVSIVSKTSLLTTTTKSNADEVASKSSGTSQLELGDKSVDEPVVAPKTRRKKTITKPTPHTFELEDELKKQKSAEPETRPKRTSTSNGVVQPKSPHRPPILSFSRITATIIDPIAPAPKTPKRKSEKIPNNPFTSPASHARQTSYSSVNGPHTSPLSASGWGPYHFVPSLKPLSDDFFNSKVIVITHGASIISSSLVRHFHSSGCRVIFGDPQPDKARKLISSLGPPDIVHFNKCEVGKYEDLLDLFRLAITMYGRVDHAIFGVGDDGAQAATVGTAENLWKLGDNNATVKAMMEEVNKESSVDGLGIGDIVSASARFAKIALPFLKKGLKPDKDRMLKSITFIASSASFNSVPQLPIYQISQHAVLGTVRSMAETLDPVKDGIRINAVITNIMIPTLLPQGGGRMSVQMPPDRPEDVARVVLGVVGSVRNRSNQDIMHGRILYVASEGAFDIQEGLVRSEAAWMGSIAKESFDRAHARIGDGCQWMLMDGLGTDL